MKHFTTTIKPLIILLTLCFASQLNAQDFIPVLSTDKVWTQSSCNLPYIFRIRATGNINNDGFTEMEFSELETGDDWEISDYSLREDGPRLFMSNGDVERLVYDMSVSIGDSVQSWDEFSDLNDDLSNIMIVSKIDSVMYADNLPRKRISFSYPNGFPIWSGFDWIEGIGPLNGLSDPFGVNIADCASLITCMEENEEPVYYFDEDKGCWYFITATEDVTSLELSISPNPVTTSFTMEIGESQHGLLSIYDLTGRTYYSKNITKGQSTESVNIIDWPNGIYLATLSNITGQISTEKIVISK